MELFLLTRNSISNETVACFPLFADCSSKRNVNIARGRNTKQSSAVFLPAAGKLLTGSLAVDGNKDSDIYSGSCMLTNASDTNPWIAVDLGKPTIVTGISLTNVISGCSKYEIIAYFMIRLKTTHLSTLLILRSSAAVLGLNYQFILRHTA
jgi:hypothetical protein